MSFVNNYRYISKDVLISNEDQSDVNRVAYAGGPSYFFLETKDKKKKRSTFETSPAYQRVQDLPFRLLTTLLKPSLIHRRINPATE